MTTTRLAKGGRQRLAAVLALLVAAVLAGSMLRGQTASDEQNGVEKAKSLSRAFRAAAKEVIPTVVKVKTVTRSREIESPDGEAGGENPFEGTPFEDFFGEDPFGGGRRFRMPRREGLGSGVIIDPKGVVLTNSHVVEGADEVQIELADGRQLRATDIRVDDQTDLAVLRIDADKPLPAARLGDSSAMDIGDWVIAVGCPFELDLTVSAGIISGKGRSLEAGQRTNFLQTDAAINPGNSGGPLVNLDGEVIGINTAIASSTGGYQGVGFAIPINVAKWVTAQLIEKGRVERAYLGVAIAEIDNQLAEKFGVPARRGVLVNEIFPGTPAAAAGFQLGDVVLRFAGQEVNTPRELQELVERSPLGSTQRVDAIRDGKPIVLEVVLKPLPNDFGVASRPSRRPGRRPATPDSFSSEELGLEVTELSPTMAQRLGYQGQSGVVVSGVAPDGLAAAAGIGPGTLVMKVGKTPVKSLDDFKEALKGQSVAKGVLLLLRTPEGNRFVVLQEQ